MEQNFCDHESITKLPVFLAVTEVIEVLMTFDAFHQDRSNIRVKTELLGTESNEGCNWYFITDNATHLLDILTAISRIYKGHFASVKVGSVQHQITCADGKLEVLIANASKRSRSSSGVLFTCKVLHDDLNMLQEFLRVSAYLHRLKLANPEVDVSLAVKCPAIAQPECTLRWTYGAVKMLKHVASIDTTAQHYARQEDLRSQTQLFARSGQLLVVNLPRDLCHVDDVKLRINCTAAVSAQVGVEWSGIDECGHVKVFLFGPNGVPLIVSDEGLGDYNARDLIPLADYNLKIVKLISSSSSSNDLALMGEPARSDWHFHLSSNDIPAVECNSNSTAASQADGNLLCIWISLNLPSSNEPMQQLAVTRWLRMNLLLFLNRYQLKLNDAVSTALRNLTEYHTKNVKRQKILETSIDTMAAAIGSIFSHSTNDEFRNRCLNRSKVSDSRELQLFVKDKLWQIAVPRHGVIRPDDPLSVQASQTVPTRPQEHVNTTRLRCPGSQLFGPHQSES